MSSGFSLCAAGDVSFFGDRADAPMMEVFSSVAPIFKGVDLSVINLENPLISSEKGQAVKGKCTLRGSVGWADIMKQSGINLVSLANNHMMDYGSDGLFSTMDALENVGLPYLGAGRNKEEAERPFFTELNGCKIAIIARSSVVVASKCYAGDQEPGVAFFDATETLNTIRECKKKSDCVIVILHWGIEQYEYPTPDQRRLATVLVRAGADMILGHHPHVLQGIETREGGFVSYSMGNFLFDEFNWSFINREGKPQQNRFKLADNNRKSGLLIVHSSGKNHNHQFIPTRIEADGLITKDENPLRIAEFKKLCSRLNIPFYDMIWKLYSLKMEWGLRVKPIVGDLNWTRIKKIRPGHVRQLAATLKRSLKITSEKSTNPYE